MTSKLRRHVTSIQRYNATSMKFAPETKMGWSWDVLLQRQKDISETNCAHWVWTYVIYVSQPVTLQ